MIIAVVGLIVATVASGQTVVLHSDFNHDTVGEVPVPDLPGDPAGDYLGYNIDGGTVTIEASYRGLDNQPAVIERQMLGSLGILHWVDPDLRDCESFDLSWRLVLDSFTEFFYMSMSSPNHYLLGSVGFRPDGVITANASGNELVTTYTPGTPQFFEVHLDMVNKEMSVMIDGVADPNGQNLRHSQVYGDGLRLVSMGFGMSDNYTLGFDDLHVVGNNCVGVATESLSWSTVKAIYR